MQIKKKTNSKTFVIYKEDIWCVLNLTKHLKVTFKE